MTSGAVRRRLLLWVLFVGFCALGMAQLDYTSLKVFRNVTYFDCMLVVAVLLGLGTLLRLAGASERSVTRTMCRIVVAYLLYELLAVIPVGAWLGTASLMQILGSMAVRATWLLFPVMLTVCADERARRLAGAATVIAAACLLAWGAYAAATGGGGYYMELGEMRYRILSPGAPLLFFWPLVLALSGAAPRRYTTALLVIAGAGLMLNNQRSDLIALAVAGLVCLVMSGQIRRILPVMVPVALLATIVALIWARQLSSVFGWTLAHMADTSGTGADRLMRWRLAWDQFSSRPFNDMVWSWRYYLSYTPYESHNFALEVATTEGLAGLAFYGSILWTALSGAWSWGRRDAEARALIGWLVAYVVYSLLNANHYLPISMPLLVGAFAALASRVDWLRRASGQGSDSHVATGVQV